MTVHERRYNKSTRGLKMFSLIVLVTKLHKRLYTVNRLVSNGQQHMTIYKTQKHVLITVLMKYTAYY